MTLREIWYRISCLALRRSAVIIWYLKTNYGLPSTNYQTYHLPNVIFLCIVPLRIPLKSTQSLNLPGSSMEVYILTGIYVNSEMPVIVITRLLGKCMKQGFKLLTYNCRFNRILSEFGSHPTETIVEILILKRDNKLKLNSEEGYSEHSVRGNIIRNEGETYNFLL